MLAVAPASPQQPVQFAGKGLGGSEKLVEFLTPAITTFPDVATVAFASAA